MNRLIAETFALLFLAAPFTGASAEETPAAEIRVGAFVTSLYGLDFKHNTFDVGMWVWFLHRSELTPQQTVEIVNSQAFKLEYAFEDEQERLTWGQAKFKATVTHDWNIASFPFDRQVLEISIEDAKSDIAGLRFVPDVENSSVDSNIELADWKITDFAIDTSEVLYDSTFGDPSLQEGSTYSRVNISIQLQRQGVRLFLNVFAGAYVAFLLSSLVFYAPSASSSFTLTSAAVFAAIGNKYIIDSQLPPVSYFTLVDKIQAATFLMIGIGAVVSVLRGKVEGTRREPAVDRLNSVLKYAAPACYVVANVIWISGALS